MATKITEPPQATEMEYFFGGGSDMCYLKEEADAYILQLKRALWLARAMRAHTVTITDRSYENYIGMHPKSKVKPWEWYRNWQMVERKCRAKAE